MGVININSIQSIERMIQIIECFSSDKPELLIKDIVNKTGLHKSTIFRILATLEKHNYIKKENDSYKYSLGINFFKIGSIARSHFDIRKIALHYMKQITDEIKEVTSLNIINNTERVCIEKIDGPNTIVNFVNIGHSNPLHIGASGKCLLAHLDKTKQEEYFNNISLTFIELENLKKELFVIHARGYAITYEERHKGSFALSSPIFDFNGEIIATLSITGPIIRLEEQRFLEIIKNATLNISISLGYKS